MENEEKAGHRRVTSDGACLSHIKLNDQADLTEMHQRRVSLISDQQRE